LNERRLAKPQVRRRHCTKWGLTIFPSSILAACR
jgi:hypothetical protein